MEHFFLFKKKLLKIIIINVSTLSIVPNLSSTHFRYSVRDHSLIDMWERVFLESESLCSMIFYDFGYVEHFKEVLGPIFFYNYIVVNIAVLLYSIHTSKHFVLSLSLSLWYRYSTLHFCHQTQTTFLIESDVLPAAVLLFHSIAYSFACKCQGSRL